MPAGAPRGDRLPERPRKCQGRNAVIARSPRRAPGEIGRRAADRKARPAAPTGEAASRSDTGPSRAAPTSPFVRPGGLPRGAAGGRACSARHRRKPSYEPIRSPPSAPTMAQTDNPASYRW
ncbi:hypothetical protein GCM10017688_44290 [Streptomyces ramulosus]